MKPMLEDQERIRQYLLGLLPDQAREAVEKDILVNDEMYAEVLIIEDELNDEYVRESLSPEERAQFESHFLAAPERQENLQFARAFNRYVKSHPSRQFTDPNHRAWFPGSQVRLVRVATAVAVVVMVAAALWFFIPRQTAPRTFATLTLIMNPSTRGDGNDLPRVGLPLGKDALKIFLTLPQSTPAAANYRVQLLTTAGESRSLAISDRNAQSVTVQIPATQLRRGQYVLNLFAIKADGSEQRISGNYSFIVE
jgi:hypothetical protein